ncbi:MAG: hypothetical protein OCC49_16570 [Fibrobacterales bacterium]
MLLKIKLLTMVSLSLFYMGCDSSTVAGATDKGIEDGSIALFHTSEDVSDIDVNVPSENRNDGAIAKKVIQRSLPRGDQEYYWDQVEPLFWNWKNRDVRQAYDKPEFSYDPIDNHLGVAIQTWTSNSSGAGTTTHPLLGVIFNVEYHPSACTRKYWWGSLLCGLNEVKHTAEWTVLFNLNDPVDNDLRVGKYDLFYYDISFQKQLDFLKQADMDLGQVNTSSITPYWANKNDYPFRIKIKRMVLAAQQGTESFAANDPWLVEKIKINIFGQDDENLYLEQDVNKWVEKGKNVEWTITSWAEQNLDAKFRISGSPSESSYYWNKKPDFDE